MPPSEKRSQSAQGLRGVLGASQDAFFRTEEKAAQDVDDKVQGT
jgi:hypothetical protein